MVRVSIALHINRSDQDVFDFISNMENNPLWQMGMHKCVIRDGVPLRVGQEYDQELHFLGRKIISHFRIMEYEPGYLIKASTINSPFSMTFQRTVVGDDKRCEVRAYIEGDPSPYFKMLEPAIERVVNKTLHKDYYALKDLLESQSP